MIHKNNNLSLLLGGALLLGGFLAYEAIDKDVNLCFAVPEKFTFGIGDCSAFRIYEEQRLVPHDPQVMN
jgi:hypothetical protein